MFRLQYYIENVETRTMCLITLLDLYGKKQVKRLQPKQSQNQTMKDELKFNFVTNKTFKNNNKHLFYC